MYAIDESITKRLSHTQWKSDSETKDVTHRDPPA
jgi:hypothetical protein